MWRGDRDSSRTPSGKGQGGLVAVYLIKVTRLLCRAFRDARFFYWLQVARVLG